MKTLAVLALLGLSVSTLAVPALAEPLPGIRGVNHIGITVPDLAEAEAFFTDVLACQKATAFGPFRDDTGTFMQDVLDVDSRAVIEQITLMRCGFGSNIELFHYTAPDQKTVTPRNSDIGGHHVAFYVDDFDAALEHLRRHGIEIMGEPTLSSSHSLGQTWVYFRAPWGMQFELVSFPNGKAYEATSPVKLWHPARPTE